MIRLNTGKRKYLLWSTFSGSKQFSVVYELFIVIRLKNWRPVIYREWVVLEHR